MAKGNAYLAKRDARIAMDYQLKLHIMQQIGMDAAMMAAHDIFQLGKGRAKKFGEKYIEYVNYISGLITEDRKDDKDCVYSRAVIDRQIRSIVGDENFDPWVERYSFIRRNIK